MKELIEIFRNANLGFLKRDVDLVKSKVSERCLCGALMLSLHNEIQNTKFKGYYTDIEYNRNSGKVKTIINKEHKVVSVTCDLIVHSRGEQTLQDNLIAIEMKKSSRPELEKNKDRERLMALTKDTFDDIWSNDGKTLPEHVCGYPLGIYYEINILNRYIELEYYTKGEMDSREVIRFDVAISI